MGLFTKKSASKTLTGTADDRSASMLENFYSVNIGFNADVVRKYQEDSPVRELFTVTEQIKNSMQRHCDLDKKEYKLQQVLVYRENASKIASFFLDKGFDVDMELSDVNGKHSMELTVRW